MKIKRSIRLVLAACFFAIMCSCASEMERDAEKLAERAVEFDQMQRRFGDRSNLQGKPISRQELEASTREYIEYSNRMMEKYSSTPEQQEKFSRMVTEKINKMR